MSYTVREQTAWEAPSGVLYAAHCVPPSGSRRVSQGWRVRTPQGATFRPSALPFATRAEAEAEAARLNGAAQ